MKIRPFNREIVEASKVSLGEIPLSYISTKKTSYAPDIAMRPEFVENSSTSLSPYQEFDTDKICFFTSDGKKKDATLKRQGNVYTYMPGNMNEFTPTKFTVSALARRAIQYDAAKNYNMNVGVLEKSADDTLALSKKLIAAFGDANIRGTAPANVTVNYGAKQPESLSNVTIDKADFIFVHTKDGTDLDQKTIEGALASHTNVWISADKFGDMLVDVKTKADTSRTTDTGTDKANTKTDAVWKLTFNKEGRLNSFFKQTDRTKTPTKIFSWSSKAPGFFNNYAERSFPYEDVLLINSKDNGAIIVTPTEFLESNLQQNIKILYDVMLSLYFTGVFRTRTMSSWITDKPIDRMAYINQPFHKSHGELLLRDLMSNDDYDIGTQYNLISVYVDPKTVIFVGTDDKGVMDFRRTGQAIDPDTPNGGISYLAPTGKVILYKPEDINMMETPISITSTVEDKTIYLHISPFKSSKRNVFMEEEQIVTIPDNSRTYYLCLDTMESNVEFKLVDQKIYKADRSGEIVAEISVDINYSVEAYDIRQMGGGLPLVCDDDYDMEDIGNVYGRPYRVGSTLIITLPKKCKPYLDKIREAVELHAAAGEEVIFRFK